MQQRAVVTRGMRDYVTGNLFGIDAICVLSRIGKVAAAATVATLIERFDVTHIVFTGVAGGAAEGIRVGDLVLAQTLVQHDMNASPLFPRFEIPLTGVSGFINDAVLTDHLLLAANDFLEGDFGMISTLDKAMFRLEQPRLHRGLIASGDEFIASRNRMDELRLALPEVLAVEMEGAAVAQVCFEFGVPFAVIRTISDGANEDSAVDFMQFIERIAARYAFGIIKRLCTRLQSAPS